MDLNGYFAILDIEVAWGEMDAYGHVNNAVYFRYIESARIKYLSEIGWDKYELEKDKLKIVLPVLAEVKARFRRPVCFPDRLTIGTKPIRLLDDHKVKVEHCVVSRKHGVATIGHSVIVAFNPTNGKVAIPPKCKLRIEEQLRQAEPGAAADRPRE